jgi:D-glycero-alpha-D-manno-heptose 1-phosphate guanylyltransferase
MAVVLAGGFGTRIRHLLGPVPKPLAPVCGQPFLHWVVEFLRSQGVGRILLLTHHASEQVQAFADRASVDRSPVSCLRESEPLGTGGSILNAIRHYPDLQEEFIVVNGDSLVLSQLSVAWNLLLEGADGVLVGVPVDDAERYGSLEADASGRLMRFAEKRPGRGLVNAGVYMLRKSVLASFDEDRRPLSIELDLFPAMLAAGANLRIFADNAEFLDIGTEATLPLAEAFVREFLLPNMRATARMENET